MRKQTIFTFAELRQVTIHCPHCGTKVTLDMALFEPIPTKRMTFAPRSCPSCTIPYDSAAVSALDNLQRVYASLVTHAGLITVEAEAAE